MTKRHATVTELFRLGHLVLERVERPGCPTVYQTVWAWGTKREGQHRYSDLAAACMEMRWQVRAFPQTVRSGQESRP
jgi:hypothetical protein